MPLTLHLRLDDGRPVLLRPIEPADADLLKEGLKHLSVESRITRFFAPISHFTDDQLDYLTDVDQHDHVAWGALDTSTDEVLGVGIGRFTRLASDPSTAEVAVAVVDAYQRHGLGALIFSVLYLLARSRGVETFRAVVMAQNHGLADRLRTLGGKAQYDGDTVTVDVPVVADIDALPDTPDARRLTETLREVEAQLNV